MPTGATPSIRQLGSAYSRWRLFNAAEGGDSLSLAGARVALVKNKVGEGDVRYFDALNDYAEVSDGFQPLR